MSDSSIQVSPGPSVCYNHPDRETALRCNRCERPICTKCAMPTPTGYRCRECVEQRMKVHDTALGRDLVVGPLLAIAGSFLGSLLTRLVGFYIILLAPVLATVLGEVIRWAVQKRRSRALFRGVAIATLLGGLPMLLFSFFSGGILGLLFQGIYISLTTSTVYFRLSGKQLKLR